jgi:hypothetical protein
MDADQGAGRWATPRLIVIARGVAEDVLTSCKGDRTQSPYGDYENCASNSAYCMECYTIAGS